MSKLLEEIREHPRTGTGQVEPLKGYDGNVYSRRIKHEHRLVYRIYDELIEVLVLSAMKYICVTPKMTENAIPQIESLSFHHISAKWKKTASLVDLIK